MKLTVVLPFYNEEALVPSLPGVLDRIARALDGHEVHALMVDDGSTDGTRAALQELVSPDAPAKAGKELAVLQLVSHERNLGVGAAMATGIEGATGDAVLVYDPDEAYAASDLRRLVDALEGGGGTGAADVATLSPYHPDGGVEGVGAFRLFLSKQASRMYRKRLKHLKNDLYTYTCAVRAYRLPQARELLPAPHDFTASAHLIACALQKGMRVVEVPAVLRVRKAGSSKMRLFRTIRSHRRLMRDLSVTAKGNIPSS